METSGDTWLDAETLIHAGGAVRLGAVVHRSFSINYAPRGLYFGHRMKTYY